jgi:hypothetical protein
LLSFPEILHGLELRLWCLTPLSTIFQLLRCGQIYWWTKPENLEKTTELSQIPYNLYHIMFNVVSSTPRLSGIRTHNVSDDISRTWVIHLIVCYSYK